MAALEHRVRAAADVVDVVDLPRGVVQEAHRSTEDQHVVVVGRAAHECARALDPVAHLEPEAVDEERHAPLRVGAAQHRVPELARAHPVRAAESRRPGVLPFRPARPVVRGGRDTILAQPGRDLDADPGAGRRSVVCTAPSACVAATPRRVRLAAIRLRSSASSAATRSSTSRRVGAYSMRSCRPCAAGAEPAITGCARPKSV